jgi:sulfate adenylyltransferase subunit 2
MFYTKIIEKIRTDSEECILFHSATGKDSIMLCDLLAKKFNKVICVFMYIVKDLSFENRYIDYAKKKYTNIEFIITPHYCLNSFIKYGYLGIKKDETIKKNRISTINEKIKITTNIKWTAYGFKKNDGLTRRIMLNRLEEGICYNTKKFYPVMDLKNNDVLRYIKDNDLIEPFKYSNDRPSSGCDISQPLFLKYLKEKYPNDLKKIYEQFPFCEAILFRYENK